MPSTCRPSGVLLYTLTYLARTRLAPPQARPNTQTGPSRSQAAWRASQHTASDARANFYRLHDIGSVTNSFSFAPNTPQHTHIHQQHTAARRSKTHAPDEPTAPAPQPPQSTIRPAQDDTAQKHCTNRSDVCNCNCSAAPQLTGRWHGCLLVPRPDRLAREPSARGAWRVTHIPGGRLYAPARRDTSMSGGRFGAPVEDG